MYLTFGMSDVLIVRQVVSIEFSRQLEGRTKKFDIQVISLASYLLRLAPPSGGWGVTIKHSNL
jgi:hypothetical protein